MSDEENKQAYKDYIEYLLAKMKASYSSMEDIILYSIEYDPEYGSEETQYQDNERSTSLTSSRTEKTG